MVAFVLPFALFMAIGLLEPWIAGVAESDRSAATTSEDVDESQDRQAAEVSPSRYTVFVALRFLAVMAAILYFLPTYREHFPVSVSPLAVLFGVVGAGLWIGLCALQWESSLMEMLGLPVSWLGERTGFAATSESLPSWRLPVFFLFRFALLVIAVPIAEELVVRGFLVRYLQNPNWAEVRYAGLAFFPLAVATIYGTLTHPGEWIAAAVWFSWITGLMVTTRNLWDCIVAHAITNLILGLYVVGYAQWQLW